MVGLALGEAGQFLRQSHHLLLINCYAVGFLKVVFHIREVVRYLGGVCLAGYEVRDIVHRTRAVQGVHRYEVLETLGMQPHKPLLHSLGFKLEYALGVASAVKVVDCRVVYRDGLYVYVHAVILLDHLEAAVYDGEGLEAQEVHLQHSHVLNLGALVLADPYFLASGLVHSHRDGDIVGKVAAADYHCAGVDSYLADAAFQLHCITEDFLHKRRAVLVLFLEFLYVFDAVGQGRFQLLVLAVHLDRERTVRNHLGEAVGLRDAEVGDARHILDRQFCRHCAEGDHVRDVVSSVVVLNVLDYAVAAFVVEVNVYIRH